MVTALDLFCFAALTVGVLGWCALMLGVLLLAEWDWTSRSEPSSHADESVEAGSRVLLDDGSLQEAELL